MASYIKNNVPYYYIEELYEEAPVRYEVPAVIDADGSIDEELCINKLEAIKPSFQHMFDMDKLYPQT